MAGGQISYETLRPAILERWNAQPPDIRWTTHHSMVLLPYTDSIDSPPFIDRWKPSIWVVNSIYCGGWVTFEVWGHQCRSSLTIKLYFPPLSISSLSHDLPSPCPSFRCSRRTPHWRSAFGEKIRRLWKVRYALKIKPYIRGSYYWHECIYRGYPWNKAVSFPSTRGMCWQLGSLEGFHSLTIMEWFVGSMGMNWFASIFLARRNLLIVVTSRWLQNMGLKEITTINK